MERLLRAKPARRSASGEGGRARVVHRKRRVVRKAMGEGEGGRVVHRKRRVVRKAYGEGEGGRLRLVHRKRRVVARAGAIEKGEVTTKIKEAIHRNISKHPNNPMTLRAVQAILKDEGYSIYKTRSGAVKGPSEYNMFVHHLWDGAEGSTPQLKMKWLGALWRDGKARGMSPDEILRSVS